MPANSNFRSRYSTPGRKENDAYVLTTGPYVVNSPGTDGGASGALSGGVGGAAPIVPISPALMAKGGTNGPNGADGINQRFGGSSFYTDRLPGSDGGDGQDGRDGQMGFSGAPGRVLFPMPPTGLYGGSGGGGGASGTWRFGGSQGGGGGGGGVGGGSYFDDGIYDVISNPAHPHFYHSAAMAETGETVAGADGAVMGDTVAAVVVD